MSIITVNLGDFNPVMDGVIVKRVVENASDEDEIVINIDSNDAVDAYNIYSILESGGYEFLPKTSDNGRTYKIMARKRRTSDDRPKGLE
ncbi:hypothetical protein [Calorimonas adulescens]|jgi:hypothetical protein|uniref:Uncharacterized protein n=1 Tax=Calorimonas adulescens TaxID=2606906 RepID=A0A5D8QDV1_9THEO|nr:hypothetical protein [Calorimonas adulescens]TZE82682.1 hypothetical protein FWJ32_03520 [Calorimonas adulescens]